MLQQEIIENNSFEACPLENGVNNADFEDIELNNTVNAFPINKIIDGLKPYVDIGQPFNMTSIFKGLITEEQIIESFSTYMPYTIQTTTKSTKDLCSQKKILMQLFSKCPTSIIFYLINTYLNIFNNKFMDTEFYKILSNIKRDGILDELNYTAYNYSEPYPNYYENLGNDLLVYHLRCFFNIQQCLPNYEDARARTLFFGFIKSGPKHFGFMRFVSTLTKKFTKVVGHMGSFIIDKDKQIIIHFEPKGNGMTPYQPFNFKKFICRVAGIDYVRQGESNKFNINGVQYTYMDTKSFAMVQTPLLNFDIFCQTYSILAIMIYILNIEQIRGLPVQFFLDIYKNINQSHAINFMNFFYDICKKDFFHKQDKLQEQVLRARNANVVSLNSNSISSGNLGNLGNNFVLVGGYYRQTRKYNRHRKITKVKKIHRNRSSNKNKK